MSMINIVHFWDDYMTKKGQTKFTTLSIFIKIIFTLIHVILFVNITLFV